MNRGLVSIISNVARTLVSATSRLIGTHAPALFPFAFVFVFSACNPAPKYVRPPAPTPLAYKETAPVEFKEGAGWKMAQPLDEHLRAKWWEMYGDNELSALEEQVRISNQTIAQAEANYRSAQALVSQARASLFPRLTTSPTYARSHPSQTSRGVTILGGSGGTGAGGTGAGGGGGGGVGGTAGSGVFNNFSFPGNLSYEVDLWHRIRNTIAANAFAAQASAADVATAILSTQTQLASSYFQIRALDAQREILDDTVRNFRATLNLTMSRFRGGIASEEDVSQAQTQLDTAIAQLTDLGVARATFEHAIATLVGRPPASLSIAVQPFRPQPPSIPVTVPSELLERRPDIASAERQVASANAIIGVQRAAYYPSLFLSASSGLQTSQFNRWFTWPSNFWSLGPTFAQTIFDGGARRALTAQAQAQYDGTVAAYRQTVLSAFQGIEDYLATLRILSQEVVEQQTAVTSASHFLDLSLARYRGGVDSYLNVITAQNAVLTNRQAVVQVQLRQMTASVSLIMELGGGWDEGQLPNMKQLTATPPRAKGTTSPLSKESGAQPQPSAPNPPPLPPSPDGNQR